MPPEAVEAVQCGVSDKELLKARACALAWMTWQNETLADGSQAWQAQQTFERAPCRNLTCMAWKLASFNELKSV